MNMMKTKGKPKKVYKYCSGIYEIPLYVTKETNPVILAKLFKLYDHDTKKWVPFPADVIGGKALTAHIRTSKDNICGILVILVKKPDMNTIAHESYHVTETYADHYDLNTDDGYANEAKAYLTGWVAECIYKSK